MQLPPKVLLPRPEGTEWPSWLRLAFFMPFVLIFSCLFFVCVLYRWKTAPFRLGVTMENSLFSAGEFGVDKILNNTTAAAQNLCFLARNSLTWNARALLLILLYTLLVLPFFSLYFVSIIVRKSTPTNFDWNPQRKRFKSLSFTREDIWREECW